MPTSRAAFALLAVVQATLIFTIALITVPLPAIARSFDLGPTGILLLQVAYGLPFGGLLLFGGRLSDRAGGRRMFVAGLALFAPASLGAALAPDATTLTAMRFLQGVGAALVAPAAVATLRALFADVDRFGRAMATWGGVSVLGAIAGFVASGAVTTWVSWRWMFALPLAVAIAGLVGARRLLPAAAPPVGARPALDLPGAALITFGISLTGYALTASTERAWSAATVWAPLGAGLVLTAAFAATERRRRDPLLPRAFLGQACRLVGLMGMFAAAAGSLLLEYVLALYLQQQHGWTGLGVASAFLPFALVLLAANARGAQLVARYGALGTTTRGLLLSAAGMALLATIDRNTGWATGLLPGSLLLAAGLSFVFSGAAVLSTANVAKHEAGLAGGVMNTAMELGPTVGFALLMTLAATQADAVRGYAWAFAGAAMLYLALAAVAARVARTGARLPCEVVRPAPAG